MTGLFFTLKNDESVGKGCLRGFIISDPQRYVSQALHRPYFSSLDPNGLIMECLSTVSFQAILPRFVQNFFARKDDASFWGGEEDLDPITHYVNTPYARTGTVRYESAHKAPAVPSSEPGKKTWGATSDSRQAEQISGGFTIRTISGLVLPSHFTAASKSRCRATTSQSDETIDSGIVELPSLPAGIHFPIRGRVIMAASEDDFARGQTPFKMRPLECSSGKRQANGSGVCLSALLHHVKAISNGSLDNAFRYSSVGRSERVSVFWRHDVQSQYC